MTKNRYDEDLKKQLVKNSSQGNHSYRTLYYEYDVSAPTIITWKIKYNNSNSFDLWCTLWFQSPEDT